MTDRRVCEVCAFADENGWWGQQGTHCMTCHRSWSGHRECHCMSCHRHFSTPTLFDAHLGVVRGEMACKDPKGGVRSEGGIWQYPGPAVRGDLAVPGTGRSGRRMAPPRGSGDAVTELEECGMDRCDVTVAHWHCACGEPCAVGEKECDQCWEEDEWLRREEAGER